MKKIFLFIAFLPLFLGCSSEDDEKFEQDYTSFVFSLTNEAAEINSATNFVVGYLENGKYIKLSSLGDINRTEYSKEVKVDSQLIVKIYLFFDSLDGTHTARIVRAFELERNKKNIFKIDITDVATFITDKSDSTQYPQ